MLPPVPGAAVRRVTSGGIDTRWDRLVQEGLSRSPLPGRGAATGPAAAPRCSPAPAGLTRTPATSRATHAPSRPTCAPLTPLLAALARTLLSRSFGLDEAASARAPARQRRFLRSAALLVLAVHIAPLSPGPIAPSCVVRNPWSSAAVPHGSARRVCRRSTAAAPQASRGSRSRRTLKSSWTASRAASLRLKSRS